LKGGEPAAVQLHRQLRRLAADWQAAHRQAVLLAKRLDLWVQAAVRAQLLEDPNYMPPDASYAGLSFVGSARALGLEHLGTGGSRVDWARQVAGVLDRYDKISRLPLSMFGRAFAASGYGDSKLSYVAQFVDVPDEGVLQQLRAAAAKLVDRAQGPAASARVFAGIAADNLVGHPKVGGCGVVPLVPHIRAMHAKWALRLVCADDSVPWVYVARHAMVPARLRACPAWWRLVLPACNAATGQQPNAVVLPCVNGALPPPLRRLVSALQVLPGWQDVAAQPLQPGAWCWNAPLWCNPFLLASEGQALPWRGLEAQFGDVANLGTINTVGEALVAHQAVHSARVYEEYRQRVQPVWFPDSVCFADWQYADGRLSSLVAALPAAVRVAAQQLSVLARVQAPSSAEVCDMLLARLGWVGPGGKPVRLAQVSVKMLTDLQQRGGSLPVQERQRAFGVAVTAAAGPGVPVVSQEEVQKFMSCVWRLPWDNQRKEVLWRVVYDGLPTAARQGHRTDMRCGCGDPDPVPGWQHHFMFCAVARAVVALLQGQLPAGTPALHAAHLFVGRVPGPGVHKGVWRVVVLAALHAMDKGRKLFGKWQLLHREGQPVPQHVATAAQRVAVATRVAEATFWDMLQDFVSLRLCPPVWLQHVGAGHPFLAVRPSVVGEPCLCVHRRPPPV
jgi:hypothetical protein